MSDLLSKNHTGKIKIYGYESSNRNTFRFDNKPYISNEYTVHSNKKNLQVGGYKKKQEQYVNLKINGKLFPTWVLANFSRYKLPELFLDSSDPCNEEKTSNKLKEYQEFLGKYLDYNSPYRDILIYHGLGSGKTRSTINIYNVLYNYSPDWNVFVLLKATLKESTWMKELDSWLQKEEKEYRRANIHFISYDSPTADKQFLETVKNVDAAKKSLYIIEEAHNFINNVYSNMTSKQGRRALTIYEHIIQDKKDNDGVRVIMISGSPAINTPFELALTFNLLRPDLFPKSEALFNQTYISADAYQVINPATKNNFQRRILGLVSYYIGATPDYYAKKIVNYVDVPMSEYHAEIYRDYEKKEEKIARNMRSGASGNYKSYTRQACNFVFPNMSQGMTGETRPRPRDFKIKESDVDSISKGKIDKENNKYYEANDYFKKVEEFVNAFDMYLKNRYDEDQQNGHTIKTDVDNFMNENDAKFEVDDFVKFINSDAPKSKLLIALHKSSSKMTYMIFNILNSPGPVLVYSNYVSMEGLQIFKIYLKYFGFTSYISRDKGKDQFRYMEYHGSIDPVDRRKVLEAFNKIDNKVGDVSKIIMISPAGAEGISLNNVRQVHIMEPFWHEVRITQMIGRAIRQCSHKALPMDQREVVVFRYKSVRPKITSKSKEALNIGDKWTTDQYIEDAARSKERLIQSFLDAMKEAAVDCVLFKAHNTLAGAYKCFQFEERSLFDDQIGPAYKDDIYDDLKLDNGLNAENTVVKRVKVVKIKAVKQLVSDEDNAAEPRPDEERYSEAVEYWYNPDTQIIYNVDIPYAVGKVGTDDDGLPLKLDKDTFIITHMIPIPHITR